jgi:uncharacterized protein
MGARARQTRTDADEEDNLPDGPERTCAVTRAKLDPEALIRFVRGPDGIIVPDLATRLPGRGVWVTNSRETVETAARINVFARSLKISVTVPPDLVARIEWLLLKRATDAVALANKAGSVITGFTKVEAAIAKGELEVLIHALDAAEDGCGKLDGKWRSLLAAAADAGLPAPEAIIVRDLSSAELSLATGRSNVIHAALRQGGAARNFLREVRRLARYRVSDGPPTIRPSSSGLDTERV